MAHMPEYAPIVVVLFLGTFLSLLLAGGVLAYAAARRHTRLQRWAGAFAALILAGYGTLLLGASLASRDRILAPGERKYFCEIDCHLTYSVERVEVAYWLGSPPSVAKPQGRFRIVTLKTWFDESTVSARRPKEVPLSPNPRLVYVADASGSRYEPSSDGQRVLEAMGRPSTPLRRPLRPGESYLTDLAFDLPADVKEPRLYVGTVPTVERVLIGHEESPLHRKIWFRI